MTGDLFDRRSELGERRRRLLDRSWVGLFRDPLLDDLPIEELLPHVDDRMGRPFTALDDLAARSLTSKVLLADSRYGSTDSMALANSCSVDLTVPPQTAKGQRSGRLNLEDFSLDEEGLPLKCPNNVAPVSTSAAEVKLQARFDLSICRGCPEKERCQVRVEKHDRQYARFQYTPARAENRQRRLYEIAMNSATYIAGGPGLRRQCHA